MSWDTKPLMKPTPHIDALREAQTGDIRRLREEVAKLHEVMERHVKIVDETSPFMIALAEIDP